MAKRSIVIPTKEESLIHGRFFTPQVSALNDKEVDCHSDEGGISLLRRDSSLRKCSALYDKEVDCHSDEIKTYLLTGDSSLRKSSALMTKRSIVIPTKEESLYLWEILRSLKLRSE